MGRGVESVKAMGFASWECSTSPALEHRTQKWTCTFGIQSDAPFMDERIVRGGKPDRPFRPNDALDVNISALPSFCLKAFPLFSAEAGADPHHDASDISCARSCAARSPAG